jgi:Spy/CpxP family protein refolding chaperone
MTSPKTFLETQRRKTMNRIRLLAIGTMLILALNAPAQQTATGQGDTDKQERGQRGSQNDLPTVETQLKVLTDKLGLTDDQRVKIKPIMEELHDATLKLMQDDNMSREERLSKVRPQRYKADKEIREILSDDQKKKLDEYLRGPHGEMHGNLSGATAPPPTAAERTTTRLGGTDKDEHDRRGSQSGLPNVEQHLKVLTAKLDLTDDQQDRIKPIIQEMNEATQKVMQDESISREKRLDNARPWLERADKEIRKMLNDDQKKQLDRLEHEWHPELHGNLNVAAPPPQRAQPTR